MSVIKAPRSTKILWIFCEGETEKYYFQKLKAVERIGRVNVKSTKKTGSKNIVKYATTFTKHNKDFIKGDTVFCVFDRDKNTNKQLKEAKREAERHGIKIIFSNPSFEFWLLIHYQLHTTSCENDDILTKLKKFIPDYHKADPELYLITRNNIETAKTNSQKIIEMYRDKNVELISRESNPVTLVNNLIEVLNNFRTQY
jgi:hypothetical protein